MVTLVESQVSVCQGPLTCACFLMVPEEVTRVQKPSSGKRQKALRSLSVHPNSPYTTSTQNQTALSNRVSLPRRKPRSLNHT